MTPQEYQAKKEARIERYRARAAKAHQESNARYGRAKAIGDMIPMGQPILVGHHSERRHRRDLEKIDNNMRKSIEASEKADYYASRALSAESDTSIRGDDPEAIDKLKKKITTAEAVQKKMVAANKLVRKKDLAGLAAMFGEEGATDLMKPDFCGRIGFASYQLQNNNANIKRMQQRLRQLESQAVAVSTSYEIEGVEVRENRDINRLQLIFPGKPDEEVRRRLKSNGFRWSPTEGAWQRQLNTLGGNAKFYATLGITGRREG